MISSTFPPTFAISLLTDIFAYFAATNALIKITIFFLIWTGVWLPLAIIVAKIVKWEPNQPLSNEQKLPLLASLYLIAPLIVWGVMQVENLSWSNYGLIWHFSLFKSLIWGLILGILGIAIIFGLELALGWIKWHRENYNRLWSVSLPILALGLWIGFTEELVFRGLLINELSQNYALWVGAAISSLIFAVLHLIWEQKATIPQLPGLWVMGMVLVFARWVDHGNLGLAWGLHAGWIWGLSCLDAAQLISYTGKGWNWVIGIGQQPLAGLTGFICLVGTGVLLLVISY